MYILVVSSKQSFLDSFDNLDGSELYLKCVPSVKINVYRNFFGIQLFIFQKYDIDLAVHMYSDGLVHSYTA